TPEREEAARALRASLGIGAGEVVVGFVGRVVRDKGTEELVRAWSALRERHPGLRLLVVGPLEVGDRISAESERLLRSDPRVHLAGPVGDPVAHYLAMDVVAIPTHREGFGNALMEANALGRPVVACRVAGCVDAVADGE